MRFLGVRPSRTLGAKPGRCVHTPSQCLGLQWLLLRPEIQPISDFTETAFGGRYMEALQSIPNSGKTASGELRKPAFKSGLAVQGLQPIISTRSGTDYAAVAQLAEHHVANVIVVGSNPISRSRLV